MSKIASNKITKLEQELMLYNKAISRDSNDPDPCFRAGNTLFKLGRYVEAIENYCTAIELDPDNRIYLAKRAKLYGLTDQADLALQDLQKISTLPRTKDFEQSYLDNIVKGVQKLDSVKTSIESLRNNPTINSELIEAIDNFVSVTKNLCISDYDVLTVLGDVA